ncbi:energy transducer TonB [Lysobacter sp. A3-1-A15]|uniref:energy transducer TonB n=1 Tax=Novilysobacter viscosus TaxID=3098602 RepID=UPI002EDB5E00
MNRIAIAVTAALLGSATFHVSAGGPEVHTFAVSLDTDGRVTTLRPEGEMPARTARELDARVRSWLFQPIDDNGGARVETWLRITTRAEGDGLHVESATTGPLPRTMPLPRYPRAAAMRGDSGVVVLRLDVDANGVVTGATPYDPGTRTSRALEQAARDAALAWRFQPERVNGRPVASTVLLPMCFLTGEPTPLTCSWNGPGSQRYSRHTVLTLEPAARLTGELAYGD